MSMTLIQTKTMCHDELSHPNGNTDRGYYWDDTDDTSTTNISSDDQEEADLLIENQLSTVQFRFKNEDLRGKEYQSYQQEEDQYRLLSSATHISHKHKSQLETVASKIRFSETVVVIPREQRSIVQNPSDCWYTSEEMETIYSRIRSLSSALQGVKEDSLRDVRDCLRGLEGIFPLSSHLSRGDQQQKMLYVDMNKDEDKKTLHCCHHRKYHQKHPNFVQTILDWQSVQRTSGVSNDPTGLRIFSSTCSKHAREEAIARGAQDFLEVQRLWKESF